MINHQAVLDSVTAMQQNAQAALPVIPNNGNPQGANNMPAQPTTVPMQATPRSPAAEDFYPWMAPSPYMSNITERINGIGMQQPNLPTTQPAAPAAVQIPAPRPIIPEPRMARFGTGGQPI